MLQIVKDVDCQRARQRSSRSVDIREASFDDYPEICSLESQYGLESKEYGEWTHLWTSNPACGPNTPNWPIGWIAESRGQVVGYVGNIPLMYELEGQPLIAAATRAWVVDTQYRNYSVPLLQRYFTQQNVDIYLGTTANVQSSPVLGMFNSVPVPAGAWDQSAFWVTNSLGFASSLIAMKGLPLRRHLSYALSGALLVRKLFAGKGRDENCDEASVSCCEGFDERFDAFWQASRREKSCLLLAVRTREVLDWHFKYAMLRDQLWILTVMSGSKLVAYSIFCRQDSPKFGLKRMRLIDFQALDGKNALLVPMLRSAIKRCHSEGIHMLEYIGMGQEVEDAISKLKPYRRKLPSWLYYYKAANDRLASRLADPMIWNPSGFDGDSSL